MNKTLYLLSPLLLTIGLSGCGGSDNNDRRSSSLSSSSSSAELSSSESSSSEQSSSEQSSSASSAPASSSSSSANASLPAVVSGLSLHYLGRYSTGIFDKSAAEIPVFDPVSQRAFVVNAQLGVVDVLDMSNPAAPVKAGVIQVDDIAAGAVVNSIAIHGNVIALAIEAAVKTDPGFVAFFNSTDLQKISHVSVGALPDMLVFSPDGQQVLVANEGEPNDNYTLDPEGSISVIDVTSVQTPVVRTADFQAFNGRENELRATGVRIYGPGASAARDLEPEYIAVSADSTKAWAVLQENNALALIDIVNARVSDIVPLGYKDHSLAGNGMDASDEDGVINISAFAGVRGMYLPDAMAAYDVNGTTYLVTANEGDARAWGEDNDAYWTGEASQGFVEEFRVKHLVHASGFDRRAGDDLPPQLHQLAAGALLNPEIFGWCGAVAGNAGDCREDDVLGRLNISWTMGYRTHADGQPVMFTAEGIEDASGDRLMYDALYSYGARSFSIWNDKGELVWDSGDQIEQYLASENCHLGSARDIPCADFFNTGHDEGSAFDSRSDAKGPEPEGLAIGKLGEKTYAFIGLERMGGVIVYDISNPAAPAFVDYLNSREEWITEDTGSVLETAGDLGPEGLVFINADDSPNGKALLIVGNEVSGTTSIYEVEPVFAQPE